MAVRASVCDIEDVNWASLKHAYGRAVDTPGHLAALLGNDQRAVARALEHLDTAVVHQDQAYPATAPVVRVLAGYLDEMAVEPGVRDALLEFLGWAAEATFSLERSKYDRRLLPDLHAALAATYHSVSAYVDAENPDLRTTATASAVSYARCAPLADQRPALRAKLRQRITDGEERAGYVALLVDLGASVADYLEDCEFDVRVTAALAPELAERADATEVLITGLVRAVGDTGATGANFRVTPAGDAALEYANSFLDPNPWRGYTLAQLIAAVIERVPDFERIAEPAAQLVRTASWTGADRTWGPLVRAAFQPKYRAGVPLARAQRLVLGALLDNPQLWAPNDGNASLVFKDAGLPRDRDLCRQILDAPH